MCLSLHKQCTSLRSLLRVQERRRSPNFYSSSSNHCSFHKLGIFGPILMKLGANSTKFGVLRCLSLSSTSPRHLGGLQTWSLLPENKNFTLESCLTFLCLKRGLTWQPVFLKRGRSRTLDVLPPDCGWSPASPRSRPQPDSSDIFWFRQANEGHFLTFSNPAPGSEVGSRSR